MSDENSISEPNPDSDKSNGSPPAETTFEATSGSVATGGTKADDRLSIGPYVLVRKLGEGGMGQVWLAQQTSPVKRQVALKLIKGGSYDDTVIERFDSERQSLAVMSHPSIAKV